MVMGLTVQPIPMFLIRAITTGDMHITLILRTDIARIIITTTVARVSALEDGNFLGAENGVNVVLFKA